MPDNNATSIDSTVRRIAGNIREKETLRKKASEHLRRAKDTTRIKEIGLGDKTVVDESLCVRVPASELTAKVVGVDGGLLFKSYNGIDLIITRAVGVYFCYVKGKLESYEYEPAMNPPIEVIPIIDSISESEFLALAGLHRALKEARTAIESAKRFRPEFLIMHGPLAPHPSSKPDSESAVLPVYNELIRAYKELYSECEKLGITLLGVVEDSRSGKFLELLGPMLGGDFADNGGLKMKDTVLLHDGLECGERTFTFKSMSGITPVGRDLGEWSGRFYSFYEKVVEFDRPVRIDFISARDENVSEKAGRIASIILSLGGFNRAYCIPTVIIEADSKAKLDAESLDWIYSMIYDQLGASCPMTMRLRRGERPF